MTKRLAKLSIATALGLATLTSSVLATTTLDTLIIYSQGAADEYDGDVETRINHLVEETNKIYKDSGLDVTMNVVKMLQYDMNDSARSNKVLGAIRIDDNITQLRNKVGADNVVMYRPYAHDGMCGVGYQNNYLSHDNATNWIGTYMYAHVSIGCGGYVTAHEVGHNSGLGHSEKQGSTGAYPYARGHGVQDTFTTVMAYSGVYNGTKIYKYSSPDLECKDGLPCGIAEGEEKEADAVKALKQTLPLMESLKEHVVLNDSEKLETALTAYNNQKLKVEEVQIEAKRLKSVVQEKKKAFVAIKAEYQSKKAEHATKKAKLNELKSTGTRAEVKSYYDNTYKPSALALKAYRTDVVTVGRKAFADAQVEYKNYTLNTVTVEKAKLKTLKEAYKSLKN